MLFQKVYTKYNFLKSTMNEKKITRLTYNDNGWISPSGWKRKSKTPGLHEADFGYGHEEWLFDFSKTIKGYKYGFIEGFRTKRNKHGGKIYNLQLFTMDSIEKEKYWVADIHNCYVLTVEEQIEVQNLVFQKGWIEEKEQQLKAIGLWDKGTSRSLLFFRPNVRFKEDDVRVYDQPIPVKHNPYIDNRDRYLIYDWDNSAEIGLLTQPFAFTPSKPNADKQVRRLNNSDFQSKEIKQLHRKLSLVLYENLIAEVGEHNVACDVPTNFGTYVDIVKKVGDHYVLYEIKTYNQLRKNIREAIGQLLEYAYWRRDKKVKEIIIVSDRALEKEATEYLNYLKQMFKLPISYLRQTIHK